MDELLRALHLAPITNETAIRLYDRLCAQLGEKLDEPSQHIIGDIAALEQLKQDLYADIKKRGVVEDFRNGRQHLARDNKSVPQIRLLMDQQRRHLNELKLTPASAKTPLEGSLDDDFNNFPGG